jgi:hypothetical protein
MAGNSSTSSSKILKAFLLVICAGVLIWLYIFLSGLYKDAASKNKINAWSKQRFDDFYALEDKLDLVFIGSSHSYCTFSPKLIDSELGTSSFQLGMPLQHPDSTYYTLKEVLAFQKPKYIVVEVYWNVCQEDFEIKQADALFQVVREGVEKEYIKNVFPWNEKIKYKIPVVRLQQDYLAYANSQLSDSVEKEFGVSRKSETQAGEERYDYRGFMYCDYQMLPGEYGQTNQFRGFDGKRWVFSKTAQKYLDAIVVEGRESGAQVLFVTAPVANVSKELMKNYDAVNKTISSFAKDRGVPYLDYNTMDLFTNENFRDDAHLNYSGAVIADAYFVQWLKSEVGYKN